MVLHLECHQIVVDGMTGDHRLLRAEGHHEGLRMAEGELDGLQMLGLDTVDASAVVHDGPCRLDECVQ